MYLKKKEVAALLRVTVRTVTTYMQYGLIPCPKKVGRILLWDEVELQRSIGHSVIQAANVQVAKRGRPRKILLP